MSVKNTGLRSKRQWVVTPCVAILWRFGRGSDLVSLATNSPYFQKQIVNVCLNIDIQKENDQRWYRVEQKRKQQPLFKFKTDHHLSILSLLGIAKLHSSIILYVGWSCFTQKFMKTLSIIFPWLVNALFRFSLYLEEFHLKCSTSVNLGYENIVRASVYVCVCLPVCV